MAQVIARHTIYRRVGNTIEKILPGTTFEPQHDDEAEELKDLSAVHHSEESAFAFQRAMEGATAQRTKPGIVASPISPHIVAMERDAMSGDLPASAAFDPVHGQAARAAQATAEERRAARRAGSKTEAPRRRSAADSLA